MNAVSYQLPRKEIVEDLVEKSKEIDEKPQRLSAGVAKIRMDDISSDKEELEESDGNNATDFTSEKGSSDSDFY